MSLFDTWNEMATETYMWENFVKLLVYIYPIGHMYCQVWLANFRVDHWEGKGHINWPTTAQAQLWKREEEINIFSLLIFSPKLIHTLPIFHHVWYSQTDVQYILAIREICSQYSLLIKYAPGDILMALKPHDSLKKHYMRIISIRRFSLFHFVSFLLSSFLGRLFWTVISLTYGTYRLVNWYICLFLSLILATTIGSGVAITG